MEHVLLQELGEEPAEIVVVYPEGTVPQVANAPDLDFEGARRVVGGHVEVVRHGSELWLVNEDGRLKGLPMNALASQIYGRVLVGPVIMLTTREAIRQVLGAEG